MAKPIGFGGRDVPDYGIGRPADATPHITDIAELSVQLGSLSWFDRFGNVLMTESFQTGMGNWLTQSYPNGANPILSSKYYSTIPYAVKLITTTDTGSYSGMDKYFPFHYVDTFGVEVHFKAIETFQHLYWSLSFYDGTYAYEMKPKVNYAANELQLILSALADEKIDDLDIKIGVASQFHVLKITGDLVNNTYLRLILDDRDYDISDKELIQTTSSDKPTLRMLFYLQPYDTVVSTVWIDNIIFTINEPGA